MTNESNLHPGVWVGEPPSLAQTPTPTESESFNASADFKANPIKLPMVSRVYEHPNGNIYRVCGFNNLESSNPEYPPMVEYVGENGNKWSKPLSKWHEKMKLSNRDFVFDEGAEPREYHYARAGIVTLRFADQVGRKHA